MTKFFQNQKIKIGFLFLSALVIYFSFGFYHIGKFLTVDEHHWLYRRVPQYWTGILNQKWKLTYVHEKPGITLALISGTGLLKYPEPAKYVNGHKPGVTGETVSMENFLTAFRLPLVIFNGFFSLFFFWALRKITANAWIALWSSIFILLSPVLIGITQIVNADALLWTFSTAALLSFVAYLKTEEKKMAGLTALFLGLSMLTKFTAVIIMPFLFVALFVFYLEKIKDWPETEAPKKILKISLAYFLILFASVLLFAVLLPASFVNFGVLYKGTFGYPGMEFALWPIVGVNALIILDHFLFKNKFAISALHFLQKLWRKYSRIIFALIFLSFAAVLANYVFTKDILRLEDIPFDSLLAKNFSETPWFKQILLEVRPVAFSLTPVILLMLLYLWAKTTIKPVKENFLVMVISIFILVFFAGVIQKNLLNIVRYSVIIYPLLAILAAIGLDDFLSGRGRERLSRFLVTIIILFFSALSLWQIKPFYLNYTSGLLPKNYIVTDGWGYGGYEAAQYLNALPDAEKMAAWSDRGGFCEFFIGDCVKSQCKLPAGHNEFDYFALTRRGKMLHIKGAAPYVDLKRKADYRLCRKTPEIFDKIKSQYENDNSVFELWIDGRPKNFIKVTEKI